MGSGGCGEEEEEEEEEGDGEGVKFLDFWIFENDKIQNEF